MPEMENPKTSRSTAKGKLTRIEKYVNDDTIEKNINDLTIRLNALENIVKDFDKAQAGVESMPGFTCLQARIESPFPYFWSRLLRTDPNKRINRSR
jgi:hypothetical protein